MKILFDHQYFSTQRYGGITRYFNNLHNGINAVSGNESSIAALYSENGYLTNEPLTLNNSFGRELFSGHNGRTYRWNGRYANFLINRGKFDVFHPTYYDPYFLRSLKKPFVLTVHDMIHERFPDYFPDAEQIIARKQILIQRADAIIAISNHTKNKVLSFFPEVESKITVVHHGYQPVTEPTSDKELPGRFILYVGDRNNYKNFLLMVEAISPLINADKQLKLVCAGGGRFSLDEIQMLNELNVFDSVIQLSATDAELQAMYQQACLFVFPSLQEGFGLPLLEAFANNCPVVCSGFSSLPEIAGDAACYFDPLDSVSIAATVGKVLFSHELKLSLIATGQQRLKKFTLQNCVRDTLNVYKSVL